MNRIAELRKREKLNQKALGTILGVAQNTICNWENEKREPDNMSLKKMASLFDCSIDYLLGRTDQYEKPTPTDGDGLSEEQLEIVRLFKLAPPALRAAALAVLRSAEGQNSVPDAALNEEKIPHSQTKHPD